MNLSRAIRPHPRFGRLIYERWNNFDSAAIMLCISVASLLMYLCVWNIHRASPHGAAWWTWILPGAIAATCTAAAALSFSVVRFYERGVEQLGLTHTSIAYEDVAEFRMQASRRFNIAHARDTSSKICLMLIPASDRKPVRFITRNRSGVASHLDLIAGKPSTDPLIEVVNYLAAHLPPTVRRTAAE